MDYVSVSVRSICLVFEVSGGSFVRKTVRDCNNEVMGVFDEYKWSQNNLNAILVVFYCP